MFGLLIMLVVTKRGVPGISKFAGTKMSIVCINQSLLFSEVECLGWGGGGGGGEEIILSYCYRGGALGVLFKIRCYEMACLGVS